MLATADRIQGAIYGLLVGDALGVPYEFHSLEEIPPLVQIEMTPPNGFRRAHASVPPATWSDDGALALALLASLLDCGRLDVDDFARRLVEWDVHGYMAVDNWVFDVGIQTSQAIRSLQKGVPPRQAGAAAESNNGNGSLMRVLPLALWHRGSDAELVADAHLQSLVTHGHIRSQVCCALYCLWARQILYERPNPWADAVSSLRAIYRTNPAALAELNDTIRPDDPPQGSGSGYVVDCLHSARLALQAGSYPAAVKAAIALGHDTDTTACVAGGIAGLQQGVQAIPAHWLAQLRGKELVQPLMDRLLHLFV